MSKRSTKIYLKTNVCDAARSRIRRIFDEFDRIFVSFSGGKDSGTLLNLCIDEARRRHRRIGAMFIDLEAFYKLTVEFVERMFRNNVDVLDPYWICLPMESPNSLSYLEPTWIWWAPDKEAIWVRPMPENEWVINLKNNPFPFYRRNMPFEQFIRYFGDWYAKEGKCANLIGIRTDESLNRYRAMATDKETWKGLIYSTVFTQKTCNFYPLYDWRADDIWTYNGKFGKDYNHLYDLFYKAGVSIYKMRVDEPFGNEAKAGLSLFRVIEPDTWAKVVNRVSGANFGNIYHGSKIMSAQYKLPKNHTWKSFTKFLLTTLPPETAANYRRKFIKFIRWWYKHGSPLVPEYIRYLEENYADDIENTHSFSKRGTGDKEVVRFRRIVDEIPGFDSKKDLLTWRRMAMCIIKNDFICKSLCFAFTKDLTLRQKALMEKYKNL